MTQYQSYFFFIRDQLCSQTFALSNLYFFGCAYSEHWDDVWDKCSSTQNWGAPFIISVIPFACRGLQSIRRYADTGLVTHLVNVRILPAHSVIKYSIHLA